MSFKKRLVLKSSDKEVPYKTVSLLRNACQLQIQNIYQGNIYCDSEKKKKHTKTYPRLRANFSRGLFACSGSIVAHVLVLLQLCRSMFYDELLCCFRYQMCSAIVWCSLWYFSASLRNLHATVLAYTHVYFHLTCFCEWLGNKIWQDLYL